MLGVDLGGGLPYIYIYTHMYIDMEKVCTHVCSFVYGVPESLQATLQTACQFLGRLVFTVLPYVLGDWMVQHNPKGPSTQTSYASPIF